MNELVNQLPPEFAQAAPLVVGAVAGLVLMVAARLGLRGVVKVSKGVYAWATREGPPPEPGSDAWAAQEFAKLAAPEFDELWAFDDDAYLKRDTPTGYLKFLFYSRRCRGKAQLMNVYYHDADKKHTSADDGVTKDATLVKAAAALYARILLKHEQAKALRDRELRVKEHESMVRTLGAIAGTASASTPAQVGVSSPEVAKTEKPPAPQRLWYLSYQGMMQPVTAATVPEVVRAAAALVDGLRTTMGVVEVDLVEETVTPKPGHLIVEEHRPLMSWAFDPRVGRMVLRTNSVKHVPELVGEGIDWFVGYDGHGKTPEQAVASYLTKHPRKDALKAEAVGIRVNDKTHNSYDAGLVVV